MGAARGMHGTEKECLQDFGGKNRRKEAIWKM
jgi:hypothetical protein